jgi:hypothetical protein
MYIRCYATTAEQTNTQQPLLSNDSLNNDRCQVIAATDTHEIIEELLEAVFSVRSTLFLGDINTGTWPSSFGKSRI